jgi:hypothetical protein
MLPIFKKQTLCLVGMESECPGERQCHGPIAKRGSG